MTTFTDILKIRKPKPKHKILKEISNRWSPRHFSDQKIPTKDLEIIFEAARWTPSGRNWQPWYFYCVKKDSNFYKNLFSTLNEYNQSWAKTAPVLILSCAITTHDGKQNPFAFYDLGAAVISLILQAQKLGYFARQIGLFDKEKVKKIFRLEKNFEPFIIIALGKIGNYKKAPKEIIQMELDPKPRKTDIWKEV